MELIHLVYRHFAQENEDYVIRAFRNSGDAIYYKNFRNGGFLLNHESDYCYVVTMELYNNLERL